MGLNKQARFFLVRLPQIFPGFNGFFEAGIEVLRLRDANAVGTLAAEVRQAVSSDRIETIDRLGQHQSQRVFS